jgi:HEAT repeat protein
VIRTAILAAAALAAAAPAAPSGGPLGKPLGAVLGAQSLAARVDAAPPGHVQFHFAARPGVCGNGRTYIQTSPGSFTGSFSTSVSETVRVEPCEPGPVRVLLDRAERQVIAVQTYVGPAQPAAGVTDLGAVPAQQAADYLLGLANRAEGRVGRDAIFPATLADSASTVEPLIAIARNTALPRDTRTRALSYAGRANPTAPVPPRVLDAVLAVARDEGDNIEVRRQAVRTLAALPHGAGIPTLIDQARQTGSVWLAKEGMSALASSGDPRAREFLRAAVRREDLGDEALAIAVRALGQQYATPQDAALLRAIYPRLRSERSREAALSAVADVGGADNVRWLLDLARSETEPSAHRRRALDQAARAGASVGELVKLYDAVSDHALKSTLVAALARSGERAAMDKLIAIVTGETNVDVRRRAISALAGSDDPRAKEALRNIVTR